MCLCFLKRTANYSAGDGINMARQVVHEVLNHINCQYLIVALTFIFLLACSSALATPLIETLLFKFQSLVIGRKMSHVDGGTHFCWLRDPFKYQSCKLRTNG